MTHECHQIIDRYIEYKNQNIACVLATVVQLNGSSYRKPGVRMLISATDKMTGALSGGCVEKEVLLQAQSVFENNTAKVITYDGRYRLGCEGLIYILIEPFQINNACIEDYHHIKKTRGSFEITSFYKPEYTESNSFGSVFHFGKKAHQTHSFSAKSDGLIFSQTFPPNFRVLIFGNEHDAESVCAMAVFCGWQVEIVSASMVKLDELRFQNATAIHYIQPKDVSLLLIDNETACVLMTHNYAKDLAYLQYLSQLKLERNYIGVLGAKKRMQQLESHLFNQNDTLESTFFENLYGPIGLDIGSVTPQEIAISILAEITQFKRQKISQDVE